MSMTMSEKENKTKRYLLEVEDSTEKDNCNWVLFLTEEDIEKSKYIKEITEESDKRFGTHNRLRLSLDVTIAFRPENIDIYPGLWLNESKLMYEGNGKFTVHCDLRTSRNEEYGIVTTKPFKIDL